MGGFGGKVAIVTGGGSGLGEAIGKSLVARGVKVVLSDIKLDSAERVAAEIGKAGGTASTFLQNTAKPVRRSKWDDGQIVEENLMYDLVSFLKQIGLSG